MYVGESFLHSNDEQHQEESEEEVLEDVHSHAIEFLFQQSVMWNNLSFEEENKNKKRMSEWVSVNVQLQLLSSPNQSSNLVIDSQIIKNFKSYSWKEIRNKSHNHCFPNS